MTHGLKDFFPVCRPNASLCWPCSKNASWHAGQMLWPEGFLKSGLARKKWKAATHLPNIMLFPYSPTLVVRTYSLVKSCWLDRLSVVHPLCSNRFFGLSLSFLRGKHSCKCGGAGRLTLQSISKPSGETTHCKPWRKERRIQSPKGQRLVTQAPRRA